jgi:hypothetical protein
MTYSFANLTVKTESDFAQSAIQLFQYQVRHNIAYQQFARLLDYPAKEVDDVTALPFLPVEFFKTHAIQTGVFQPETFFYSSGTTDQQRAAHPVKSLDHYHRTALQGFERTYGHPRDMAILGLLPSYLDNPNASLVSMVRHFVGHSAYSASGFFLDDLKSLADTLRRLEEQQVPTLLIGVSFALLDLAESYPVPLHNTIVMETGGMKGRRKEMIRDELHETLKQAFGLPVIHSEYGMTELLSQAYASRDGLFQPPPWMDPLHVTRTGKGALNIIDLANEHSCAFLATQDLGTVYEDGTFEVSGRFDHADVRGCNLMAP